jgi:Flp pilus assembly protein TadG
MMYCRKIAKRGTLGAFRSNESGAIAIIAALGAMLIFGSAGVAIDFARIENGRSEVQSTLDGAVMAAARTLSTTDGHVGKSKQTGKAHFDNNKPAWIQNPDVKIEIDGNKVTGEASFTVPLTLTRLFGLTDKSLTLTSAAATASSEYAGSNMEFTLVLDVSGSMCDDGTGPCTSSARLTALKDAASDLVDRVIWADQSTFTSRMSIIPYSTRVRLADNATDGATIMSKVTDLPPSDDFWYLSCTGSGTTTGSGENIIHGCASTAPAQTTAPIRPCVTSRAPGSDEFTDAAPGPDAWLNGHHGTRHPLYGDSLDVPLTAGLGSSDTDLIGAYNHWTNGACDEVSDANKLVPLTSDTSKLKAAINGLQAEGGTAGALGIAMGWYTLSPNWNHIWLSGVNAGSYTELQTKTAAGKPSLRKVAIIMSDGLFNTFRGNKAADPAMVNDRARTLCTNMKAKGIEIYTVGVMLDQLPSSDRSVAETTLKNCGTSLQHFFNTTNVDELKGAFKNIGDQATPLRLLQ